MNDNRQTTVSRVDYVRTCTVRTRSVFFSARVSDVLFVHWDLRCDTGAFERTGRRLLRDSCWECPLYQIDRQLVARDGGSTQPRRLRRRRADALPRVESRLRDRGGVPRPGRSGAPGELQRATSFLGGVARDRQRRTGVVGDHRRRRPRAAAVTPPQSGAGGGGEIGARSRERGVRGGRRERQDHHRAALRARRASPDLPGADVQRAFEADHAPARETARFVQRGDALVPRVRGAVLRTGLPRRRDVTATRGGRRAAALGHLFRLPRRRRGTGHDPFAPPVRAQGAARRGERKRRGIRADARARGFAAEHIPVQRRGPAFSDHGGQGRVRARERNLRGRVPRVAPPHAARVFPRDAAHRVVRERRDAGLRVHQGLAAGAPARRRRGRPRDVHGRQRVSGGEPGDCGRD